MSYDNDVNMRNYDSFNAVFQSCSDGSLVIHFYCPISGKIPTIKSGFYEIYILKDVKISGFWILPEMSRSEVGSINSGNVTARIPGSVLHQFFVFCNNYLLYCYGVYNYYSRYSLVLTISTKTHQLYETDKCIERSLIT